MKIMILGSNGYLGNALMYYMSEIGHDVIGLDNGMRSVLVKSIGSKSMIPVKKHPNTEFCDICQYDDLHRFIKWYKPEVIVHFAEQPSAPYSMIGPKECAYSQLNNIKGTLNLLWAAKELNPDVHIIKFGTAGEYNDALYGDGKTIPEGATTEVMYEGRPWVIPTPRYAGSFYHFSKIYDSLNCDYASKVWGLRISDLNQGVVYGHRENTRFDYDFYFSTVVNRFVVQALIDVPLTIYGTGEQERGFIHIDDVMKAIKIISQDAPNGYRVIHQLTEVLKVNEIARMIGDLTGCKTKKIVNPRREKASNQFNFEAKYLLEKGLQPRTMKDSLDELLKKIEPYKNNAKKEVILGNTRW